MLFVLIYSREKEVYAKHKIRKKILKCFLKMITLSIIKEKEMHLNICINIVYKKKFFGREEREEGRGKMQKRALY